jgi:hypothetical protein
MKKNEIIIRKGGRELLKELIKKGSTYFKIG